MNSVLGHPKDGKITEAKVRELRHGYYACVSYVDALIGKLLKELDRLKLRQTPSFWFTATTVFIWGTGLWTKANNFELSTRVPLIVSAPGQSHGKTDALVELVDVFPTVCELAGFEHRRPGWR